MDGVKCKTTQSTMTLETAVVARQADRGGAGSFCYGNGGRANRKLVSTTCATNRRFRNLPGTRWRQRRDHTYHPRGKLHYAVAAAAELFLSTFTTDPTRHTLLSHRLSRSCTNLRATPCPTVSPSTADHH